MHLNGWADRGLVDRSSVGLLSHLGLISYILVAKMRL